MKKPRRYLSAALFSSLYVLAMPLTGRGFEDEAHKALSDRATRVSSLDSFLKTILGSEFPEGIEQVIKDGQKGRVLDLIAEIGAVNEDRPLIRSRHHFHNPTLAWDQAGWRPLVQLGISSALWSQDPTQSIGGKHSWKDARDSYFNALIATDAEERKSLFAETFVSLGHLIHLVQDLATPAHSRNDSHIISDLFHEWAEEVPTRNVITTTNPVAFSSSFLQQPSPNGSAPVPISRLFDTTAGDLGASALGNGDNIGIAEFSNANFFSDDTILPEPFTFPGLLNLEPQSEIDQTTGKKSTYVYFKSGFGETNYRLGKVSSLRDIVATSVPTEVGLDVKVMQDYGGKLFPRAIGYSAGLIDYFFRNLMSGDAGDVGCGPFPQVKRSLPYDFTLNVGTVNFETHLPGEQTGIGRIVVVVHYKLSGQTQYFTLLDTTANLDNQTGASWTLSGESLTQIPEQATDVYFIIAYRGPLGVETDAVIGGRGDFFGLC